ncbi:MAG: type II secretion system F family protein [Bdellovibrionales bacterium]|nr:type II secretion system F family protein [Bdellovibrionales bacterium]
MNFAAPHWLLAIVVFISALLVAYQFSGRILDWIRFQSIGTRDYIADKLQLMMMDIPPERILIGQVSLSLGLGMLVFLLCLPNFAVGGIFGVISMLIGWILPRPIIDIMYGSRCTKFVEQMVDGLGLMSNGMRSGLSVVQAMGLVAQEMPNPIQQEFNLILSQNKLGVSLEEAFLNLSRRVVADEVEMFVTSVNILKETGGNLAETFDTITTLIRERIKVEGKIKAMTAQAFWQGIILMCVPPFMATVLSQSDPELMRPMFTHPLGWVILTVVVILEVAAFFMIRKVTKIDV